MPGNETSAQLHFSEPYDIEYWQSKFALLKLGAAIRNVQPKRAILRLADEVGEAITRLRQHYPMHQAIHGWCDQLQTIHLQDDHDIHDRERFSERFYWGHTEFEAGWIHYHMAMTAALIYAPGCAAHHARLANHHLQRCLAAPLHCPRKIQRWLIKAAAESENLMLSCAA